MDCVPQVISFVNSLAHYDATPHVNLAVGSLNKVNSTALRLVSLRGKAMFSTRISCLGNTIPMLTAIVAGNGPTCDSSPIHCEEVKDVARLVASLPHTVACEPSMQPEQETREGRFNIFI